MKRKNAIRCVATLVSCITALSACHKDDSSGPPVIQYDESVCIDCGMIISDERYASATIVEGERGSEALLFDDVGDQVRYEYMHPNLVIVARWVHDQNTREWIDAEEAFFIRSKSLHTPMASGIASFKSKPDADAALQALGTGDSFTRAELWHALKQ